MLDLDSCCTAPNKHAVTSSWHGKWHKGGKNDNGLVWNVDGMDEDGKKWTQQWPDAGCARKHSSTRKFHSMKDDGQEEQSRAKQSRCDGATMTSLAFGTCWCVTTADVLLALFGGHDTWCISRGQVSDYSWPFVCSTKQCPRTYDQHPPCSSEHISVWGAAERHFRPGACCSSLSLSLCLCFLLGMSRRTRHVGSTRFHKNVLCCLNIKWSFM